VPPAQLFGCLLRPSMLGIGYGLPLLWIGKEFPPNTWLLICLSMILGGCGYLALAAVVVLDAGQRQMLSERLFKRFRP